MSIQFERDEAETMHIIAGRIRREQAICDYDYRKFVPKEIQDRFPQIAQDYHVKYGHNKYAVAKVLQPSTIYEVGVGWGISASAFCSAYPQINYFGVDNGEMGLNPREILESLCPTARVETLMADTDSLQKFEHPRGKIDLIHIDGNHERAHKTRDVIKAIVSGAEWLLCDDCHNADVVTGVFDAFQQVWKGSIPIAFMENSHTGGMLFHIGGKII